MESTMFGPRLAILSGKKARCPFCLARDLGVPKIGERIQILNGSRAGTVGTVSNIDLDARFTTGSFFSRFDTDDPEVEQIINPTHDLYRIATEEDVYSEWLPPLSMRDLAELDSVVVNFISRCSTPNGWSFIRTALYRVIGHCWLYRLPISAIEVWDVISAHGVPNEEKAHVTCYLEMGTELLVCMHRRRPIKKKRVSPMSVPT